MLKRKLPVVRVTRGGSLFVIDGQTYGPDLRKVARALTRAGLSGGRALVELEVAVAARRAAGRRATGVVRWHGGNPFGRWPLAEIITETDIEKGKEQSND